MEIGAKPQEHARDPERAGKHVSQICFPENGKRAEEQLSRVFVLRISGSKEGHGELPAPRVPAEGVIRPATQAVAASRRGCVGSVTSIPVPRPVPLSLCRRGAAGGS